MTNTTEIIDSGKTFLGPIKEASNYVKDFILKLGIQFPDYLYGLLTVFVGAVLIWIATKVTNNVAKWIMIIVGVILIIGMILSIIPL